MSKTLLNDSQKKFLLKLARDAITHYLNTGKHMKIKIDDSAMKEKRGAFVTIKVNRNLRGCIGYPLPTDALSKTIIDAAIMAATKDYRFQPLTKEELSDTRIEISVLSLPQAIKKPSEIQIGKHGIIVTRGMNKGLLLPQVPLEWNWDLKTYLRHGCLKAGLEEDAWKKDAEIQIFSAQVFSE
jgi:AmmeMemoRadiSam system protein A